MHKESDKPVDEPDEPRSLLALLRTLDPIEEDFAPVEDIPAKAFDL